MEIDRNLITEVRGKVVAMADSRYNWGRGELRNAVFEYLVIELGLPCVDSEVGSIPDFSNPEVEKLHKKLAEFPDLFQ